jgi:uncharacterized membrane protein
MAGTHPDFLLLLWLPVFCIFPCMYSLFLFQSLMISLAARPVYLLARDATGNRMTALIAAAGLLLYAPVASVHVFAIHDDAFALAALLFAFYFFQRVNLRGFVLCMAVSLLA